MRNQRKEKIGREKGIQLKGEGKKKERKKREKRKRKKWTKGAKKKRKS